MRTVINISLPKDLALIVERFIKKGRYASKSEFVRELIREKIAEEDLLNRIRKSEAEFRAGKGKLLRSLNDLR